MKHGQVESQAAKNDLLDSLPSINKYLNDPKLAETCSEFVIVFVGKDGNMTNVIPPDEKLKSDAKTTKALHDKLQAQVKAIETRYADPAARQQLKADLVKAQQELTASMQKLQANGFDIPKIKSGKRMTVLDASSWSDIRYRQGLQPATPPVYDPTRHGASSKQA